MSSKTKIFVFKMRELIYTGIFVALAVLLIVLLVFMFRGKSTETGVVPDTTAASYTPGIYHASLLLGEHNLEVAVAVDANHINSVRFTNLSDAVTAMYPLMESSMNTLAEQIVANQSTDNVQSPEEAQYTSAAILDAIRRALDKAYTH